MPQLVSTPYNQDGLHSIHNHDFLADPNFKRAYARGVVASGEDYQWHWRVHIGLWAAKTASILDGDFVECGVNRGFLSSAIMAYLDWDSLKKTFYLLDTFTGLNCTDTSKEKHSLKERERNSENISNGFYTTDVSSVRENFSEWQNHKIVEGIIPDTLSEVQTEKISFLHLDLNCALPEVAALEYFWPMIVDGGIILLDDYAYLGYENQKYAMDNCVKKYHLPIVSLPTGQGLLIKLTGRKSIL